MNEKIHAPHNIIRSAFNVADRMEPLKTRKDPTLAAICGFAFGGVGLGLYLKSWPDFLIPFGMMLVLMILSVPTGGMLSITVPFFWAIYGFRRVKASNRALECNSGDFIEAEVIEIGNSKMLKP